jgi:hypothetical protein
LIRTAANLIMMNRLTRLLFIGFVSSSAFLSVATAEVLPEAPSDTTLVAPADAKKAAAPANPPQNGKADDADANTDQSAKATRERARAKAAEATEAEDRTEMNADVATKANVRVEVIAGNDDANLDPAEREMRNRLQPVLKKELLFAARVCKLDKPQRKALADAGQEAIKKAAYQYTQSQHNVAQRQFVIFNGETNSQRPNPVKLLQTALQDAAKETLPPDKTLLLNAEFTRRADYHKHAVIENLVVMLDKKLGLTEKQRSQIADSLYADWDDAWASQLQIYMYDQDIFPRFPEKCLTPYLLPAQKTVWDDLPNKNVQFAADNFEVDPIIGGMATDSDDDDP